MQMLWRCRTTGTIMKMFLELHKWIDNLVGAYKQKGKAPTLTLSLVEGTRVTEWKEVKLRRRWWACDGNSLCVCLLGIRAHSTSTLPLSLSVICFASYLVLDLSPRWLVATQCHNRLTLFFSSLSEAYNMKKEWCTSGLILIGRFNRRIW